MGILTDLGVEFSIPKIDITGWASSSWMWVAFVVVIGLLLVIGLFVFLFFMTYKKKVILFENISGQGYQPVLKTRARTLKLGVGGEEILKTLKGGHFVSAYGRKMGKNTFWYAKGEDGYWYNIVVGDLDSKRNMLDIDPIDRDVRMFHVALDRLSHATYGKTSFMEKYGVHMMLFLFLICLVLGMWFFAGKLGEAVEPLAAATTNSVKIQEANDATLSKLDSLIRAMGYLPEEVIVDGGSGLAPAT